MDMREDRACDLVCDGSESVRYQVSDMVIVKGYDEGMGVRVCDG